LSQKTDIRLRRSNVLNAVPGAANLSDGELAINTNTGALYFKKSNNVIITAADDTIFHIDSDTDNSGANKKIGIGTTSPAFKLSVDSGTSDWPGFFKSTDNKAGIIIADDDTTGYFGVEGDKAFMGIQAGSHANNLNITSSGNVGLGVITANLQSSGKGIHIHDDANSEIKFTNDTTGSGASDGTALVTSGNSFSINNREAGLLHFGTSNTNRMSITAAGNVGIGTTSPNNKLSVSGASDGINIIGTSSYLRWNSGDMMIRNEGSYAMGFHTYDGSSAMVEHMRISSAGSVGIGTNNPVRKLHVYQPSGTNVVAEFESSDAQVWIDLQDSNSGSYGCLIGHDPAADHLFMVADGNVSRKLVIDNDGNVGIGTTNPANKLHVSDAGGAGLEINPQTANDRVILFAYDRNTSTYQSMDFDAFDYHFNPSGTEKMRLTNGGNLGIGTSSPDAKLQVAYNGGHTSGNISLTHSALDIYNPLQANTDEKGAILTFSDHYQDANGYPRTIRAAIKGGTDTVGNTADGFLAFYTDSGGANSASERMRITSAGKVGIGTASPAHELHIMSDSPSMRLQDSDGTNQFTTITQNGGALQLFARNGSNNGSIQFQGNDGSSSTEYGRFTPSGHFLIGNATSFSDANANDLQVGNTTGAHGISIMSNSSHNGNLFFGDNDNNDAGRVSYNHTNNRMEFYTNRSQRMVITSDGNTIFGGTSVGAAGAMSVKVDGSYTDLYLYGAGTSQGGRIFFGDSSDRSSITGTYGTGGGGKLSFKTDTTGGTSQDRLVIDSDGSIRFNNAFTFPTSIGSAGQVLKVPNSGSVLVWSDQTGGGGSTDSISDSDGDTKIQVEESADEDLIRFDTAGVQRMVILANGNVGINNTSPSAKLTVSGTALVELPSSSNAFRIQDTQNSAERLRVTQAGNVGIGTSSPVSKLTVGDSTTNATAISISTPFATNNYGDLVFTTVGTTTYNARIRATVPGNGTRELSFITAKNASENTVMTLDGDGKVGIGTSSPATNLEISGSNPKLRITDTRNQSFTVGDIMSSIEFDSDDVSGGAGTSSEPRAAINMYATTTFGSSTGLEFRTKTDSTDYPIQRMVIGADGKVGIGQSSPTAKLHIVNNATTDTLLLATTEASNAAGPVLTFKRNSSSPADADYLGQLKFKGENDSDQEVVYAKITAKILDASAGTEDGLIEFANRKNGANEITARLRSDSLQLLNGTGLTVAGDTTISGNLTVEGTSTTLNVATLDVEDKNITLNYGSGDTTGSANGAGITIQDAVDASTDATILWDTTNDEFDFSHGINTAGTITTQKIIGTQTQGSSLYGLKLTRSSSGTTTPDLWGENDTLVIGTSSSTEAVAFSSADSIFYGDLTIPTKIRHSGDTDNYISFPAADTQSFVTGNSTRFQISNSLARFNQEGLNQDFQVFGQNNDNLIFADASTDRVGIGTNVPETKLHVQNGSDTSPAVIITGGHNGRRLKIQSYQTGGAAGAGFIFNADSSYGALKFQTTSTDRMVITQPGNVGIGTASPSHLLHVTGADGSIANMVVNNDNVALRMSAYTDSHGEIRVETNHPLLFKTNGNNERMRITSAGNVGIGTASPDRQLEVEGQGVLRLNTTGSNTDPGIDFNTSSVNDMQIRYRGGTDKLAIYSYGTTSDVVTIQKSDGRVGIGTSSPANTLHVNSGSDNNVARFESTDGGAVITLKDNTGAAAVANIGDNLYFKTSSSQTDRMTILSNGRVGIGTTSPSYMLDIGGGDFFVNGTNRDWGGTAGLGTHIGTGDFDIYSGVPGGGAHKLKFTNAGNLGIGTESPDHILELSKDMSTSPTSVIFLRQTGTNQTGGGGAIRFDTSASNDDHTLYYASVEGIRSTSTNGSNELHFKTTKSGVNNNAPSTKMVVDEDGNVGIGTTTPTFKLDVQEANGNTLARFKDSDSSHSGIIIAGDVNAGWVGNDVGVTGEGIYYQSSNNFMRFYTNSSEQMRIDNSGRLLVNATSTAFNDKLYIGGDGYATGGWRTGTGATFVGELTNLSGKLALQSDASRDIQLGDTNNPDIVYIDTSAQRVGIGTTSPSFTLHTKTTGNTVAKFETSLTSDLAIELANSQGSMFFGLGGGEEFAVGTTSDLNGSGNLFAIKQNGNVGIGTTNPKAKLSIEEYGIDTSTTSTAATTQVTIHSFPIADFRTARFTIQITNTTDSTYHSTEIIAVHDGTTANITEFGEVHTGSSVEATFDADISSSNFRLRATPTSTNAMSFKVVCHSITV